MRSFLTGSHVYGTPKHDSDIDLVIQLSSDEELQLLGHSDGGGIRVNDSGYPTIRFGNLQLIAVEDDREFSIWKSCTEELRKRAPVTREEAVNLIKKRLEA